MERMEALYAEVLARPRQARSARVRRALPRAGLAAGGLALAACGLTASLSVHHARAVLPAPAAHHRLHLVAHREHGLRVSRFLGPLGHTP